METIDITLDIKKMWNKKKLFFIVWIVVLLSPFYGLCLNPDIIVVLYP